MTDLLRQLKDLADGIRRLKTNKHWRYCCFEDFVSAWGRNYQAQPLPDEYERGIKQHCFANARNLALEYDPGLIYVEGYACLEKIPFPIHHAWCVEEGSDLVIDSTPTAGLSHYAGVPFHTHYLVIHELTSTGASLIDDLDNNFPLLSWDDDKLCEVIVQEEVTSN